MSNGGTKPGMLQRVSKVAEEMAMVVTRMPVVARMLVTSDRDLTLSGFKSTNDFINVHF